VSTVEDQSLPAARLGGAFAGVFAVTFCGLVAVGAVLPVLPRYIHGPLGAGNVAVGIVIGSYAVTGLLLRPVAGRLADHRGRKPTVLLGSILTAVGGFMYLLPFGVPGLIAARLFLGAGEGTVFTASSAWIVDLAPPERRGRVIGLYGLSVWAGLSVGPLIGELIMHDCGYTWTWIFAGAAPLLGALIAVRLPDPFHALPHPDEVSRSLIEREALRPGIAIALAAVGYATIAAFVVLHLDARGVGHGATVFGAFATMVVLTRLIGGNLPDRVGPARVAMAAAVVEAIGLTAIALSQSLVEAFAGALAMGAAFSLLYPSLSLIVVGRVSDTRRGAALGTFTAFFDGGIGLGAPIAGAMAALSSYEGAFLLAAAIALVSAATIALLIAPRSRPSSPPSLAGRREATERHGRFCPARRIARTRPCRCR
jgi:MFS family permease